MSGGRRPVVLSIRNADMQGGRIFDLLADGPVDQAPYTPWRCVRDLGRAAGLELLTADQVAGIDPRSISVISYDWPPSTDDLVARGAQLAMLTTLEPPLIAWELFYKLPRISTRFPHVLLWEGARKRVAPTAAFHRLYFPQVRVPRQRVWPDWSSRRFLVSINSNKAIVRSFTRWFDRPREVSVKREVASRLYPPIAAELYLERARASAYFSKRQDFDAFGQAWQRRHPAVPRQLHDATLRAYRGTVGEKLTTLAQYRFALCLENSRFAGYVSEKIFDCFFCGTIPIYLGAPDIERYIPAETFVDLRQYRSYADLETYLDSMTVATAQTYLDAAQSFLDSPAFEPFSVQAFAHKVVNLLVS